MIMIPFRTMIITIIRVEMCSFRNIKDMPKWNGKSIGKKGIVKVAMRGKKQTIIWLFFGGFLPPLIAPKGDQSVHAKGGKLR